MSIESFFDRDVTVIEPSWVDGYGDAQVKDFDHPARFTQTRGWLHQLTETETIGSSRDNLATTHVLRLPASTPITAHSRVKIEGQTFEVDGPPGAPHRPGSGVHHLRVPLRWSDG